MLMILAALCAGRVRHYRCALVLRGSAGGALAPSPASTSFAKRSASLPPSDSKGSLRRRGAVNFGGITLVSGNLAANWTQGP